MYRLTSRIAAYLVSVCVLMTAACAGNPEERKQRYLSSGDAYFEQEQYAEAVIEYSNAVQIDPVFGEVREKRALAYARLGDHVNALQEYVRAADLQPDDLELQIVAGRYLLLAGRADDARARAEVALQLDPENVSALILLGNALAGLQDFETAIEKIEEAIQLEPASSAGYANIGVIEAARGRPLEAEAAFFKATEVEPSSVEAHLALASLYWAERRPEDAEASFRTAYQLAPEGALVNRALAALTLATGRAEEAEGYLKTVARSEPGPAAEMALADYYLAVGRPRDAIATLDPLRTDMRASIAATHGLARAYAALGDSSRASELADDLLSQAPMDAGALLLKGQLLSAQGQDEDAFERVKEAVSASPESARAQYALGRMLAARGDVDAAKSAFAEVLRINPLATVAEIELSKLELMSGGTDASIKLAQAAVNRAPDNLDARLALVRSLLASGDVQRAEDELEAHGTTGPNAAVLTHRAMVAGAKNDTATARQLYEEALALDPYGILAVAGLVGLDLTKQDFAAARARMDQQLATYPDRVDLLILAARVAALSTDPSTAERHLRRAIDVEPSSLPAYSMLGQLYQSQGKLDQAVLEYEEIAKRLSRPVAALTMAGVIYQSQGKTELARERFEQVLDIEPRAAIAANNLAWMLAESGENLDRALELAQAATAAMPESPEVRDTLGWIYYKRRLTDLAISAFGESVRGAPQNATYHHHLALAHLQAGDTAKATDLLERALSLDPDFPAADDARTKVAELSAAR